MAQGDGTTTTGGAEPATVVLWNRNGLRVRATREPDGRLHLHGHHLGSGTPAGTTEYEYALTVATRDVPTVVSALGGGPDDDVLALLLAHQDVLVGYGESRWLTAIGVEAEFWARVEPD